MSKWNVEYDQLTCLLSIEVEAETRDLAEKEAFKHLMKYDRDSYDFVTVNEIVDEDGSIDERERIMIVSNRT